MSALEVSMSRYLPLVLSLIVLGIGSSLGAQLRIRDIPFESASDVLKGLPDDVYIGEAAGVATNSRGHLFVYTRTGSPQLTLGTERHFHRGAGGARLFEFDQSGKYLREIGQGLYGFIFAHTVRVDTQDNIWTVDEGSGTIVKFSPQGEVQMVLGRTPEYLPMPGFDRVSSGPPPAPTGPVGTGVQGDEFDRPTDVALDKQGNIFVADGHVNARIAKFDANGRFVKSWGSLGTAPGQFNVPHSLVTDAAGQCLCGGSREPPDSGVRQRRHLQDAVHQCRHAVDAVHDTRAPSVPLQLELERPARIRPGRGDLQTGARWAHRRQVRPRGQAPEGIQHRPRDRLPRGKPAVQLESSRAGASRSCCSNLVRATSHQLLQDAPRNFRASSR